MTIAAQLSRAAASPDRRCATTAGPRPRFRRQAANRARRGRAQRASAAGECTGCGPVTMPECHTDVWSGDSALLLLIAALLSACSRAGPAPHLVARTHPTMGSEVTVTVWTADEAAALPPIEAVFAEFDRLDALMSVWKPGSDILRVNAAAGQHAVPVSAERASVLAHGSTGQRVDRRQVRRDVRRAQRRVEVRSRSGQSRARRPRRSRRGCRSSTTRPSRSTRPPAPCSSTRPGMRVHLGGIGKGYAVDRAVAILRARGLRDFMVQAGGDLYVGGRPGRRAVAPGHQRSARRAERELRDDRAARRARSARQATTSDCSSRTGSAITTSSIPRPASPRAAPSA